MRRDVFIGFIDYKKAFDSIRHKLLIELLQDIGVVDKHLRIIS